MFRPGWEHLSRMREADARTRRALHLSVRPARVMLLGLDDRVAGPPEACLHLEGHRIPVAPWPDSPMASRARPDLVVTHADGAAIRVIRDHSAGRLLALGALDEAGVVARFAAGARAGGAGQRSGCRGVRRACRMPA